MEDWLAPETLVGEVMAHQDVSDLRSVKQTGTAGVRTALRPFGVCSSVLRLGATPEQQSRPLEIPSVVV